MYNPYNYHVAVRDDAMFFGREKIVRRLTAGLSAPVPLSAAVFGGRRSGKTSLLSKLRRDLMKATRVAGGRCFIPCSLDLQRGRPLKGSDDFFLWVLEELGEVWEQRQGLDYGAVVEDLQVRYREGARRGPVDAFVRAFRSLDTQGERIRLAILIDESENILTVDWGADLRPNLRYLLSNSPVAEDVALVMAGSTVMYNKVTERDSPLENILDRYLLETLSPEATLALAQEPNAQRLSPEAAREVYCQSGGQPCMAQFILHELWAEFEGDVQEAGPADVQDLAAGFEQRTRHFSAWTQALGPAGWAVYLFLLQEKTPTTHAALRTRFPEMTITELQSRVDALVYHGLIRCQGRGRGRCYQTAGQMYRDWFVAAGKLGSTEDAAEAETPTGFQVLIERLEQHIGAQTNIGEASGPIGAGQFNSAASFGDDDAVDRRKDEGSA